MAHAIFNVSPVKFLSSIQDHVFTVTPSFKNKSYRKADKSNHNIRHSSPQDERRNSSASPVTLQLTLPTETVEQQMVEMNQQQQQLQEANQQPEQMQEVNQQPEQMQEINQHLSSVPIDIPRSYPLNVPMNSNHRASDYEGLMPNNMLSTSYGSHHSSYGHDNNLVALANSIPNMGQSPYLPADDLTLCFDGLAVRSPTNSYYSNHNGVYSPQQINSPVNIGSPHGGRSPLYFGSPQSPNYNSQFLAGSPSHTNNSQFVGSPNSPPFLGSPSITPFIGDSSFDPTLQQHDFSSSYGFAYLSPSLTASIPQNQQQQQQQHLSPINSPSPTGSYAGSNYLFPPTLASTYSRSSSPVPDDVILTASEVNDYINSPYLSASVGSNNPSPTPVVQPLSINTDMNSYDFNINDNNQISEFLMDHHHASPLTTATTTTTATTDFEDGNIELFPSVVQHSSPHAQPQSVNFPNKSHYEEEEDDLEDQQPKPRLNYTRKTTSTGRRAKIHQCPHCPHTSNRANNMREHVQIHNPNRPKPHACKLCNRAFARKHDMNRHYISCKKQLGKSNANRYLVSPPPLIPHA